MKLNNKGFAISTVMYMILIMAIVLITLTLTLLSSRKLILDKTKDESKDNIYGVFDLSYRQVLEILKSEAIEYAITNNVEKDSIMISNLNSSIDKEILDGYKLSEKYLTMISNDSYYDIYLGKSKTVTNLNESINNLIDIVDYKIEGNSYQDLSLGNPSPDNPVEVKSVGNYNETTVKYEIPVIVSSKNLFDYTKIEDSTNISKTENGISVSSYATATGITAEEFLEMTGLQEGDTITTSRKFEFINSEDTNGCSSGMIAFVSKNADISSYSLIDTQAIKTTVIPENFTSDNYYGLYFYGPCANAAEDVVVIFNDIQIEKGDQATEYEPYVREVTSIYLNEPLRCAGTYCDYINLAEDEIAREVGIYNFNTDTFDDINFTNYGVAANNNNLYRHYISFKLAPKLKGTRTPGFTNVLPSNKQGWNSWTYEQAHFGQANAGIYALIEKDCANVTDLYNYLSNNGTIEPYFIYPLSEVGKNSIELPKILTGLGYNSAISINTEIQPSSVEFTVIQKIKQL